MGDRANVVIKQSDGARLYLYTHWGGSELPADLARALAKEWRWDDESYLARIILEEMIPESSRGRETGFGIATSPPDNEHPFLVVDCATKTVTIEDDARDGFPSFADYAKKYPNDEGCRETSALIGKVYSFVEFTRFATEPLPGF